KGKWVYFDLKDDQASVKFFGSVYGLPGPLEDGLVVQVLGTPKLSPLYGFSVGFRSIRPVGEGSLKRAADLLHRKLEREGLFALERKRVVPFPPRVVGLVTSGQSAAYHDFIKVLGARWQDVTIIHVDVGVQGERATGEVVHALELLNQRIDVEVVVMIRGGGSADDLAVFSTEQVTRAFAGSRLPTVVAIGHEVDISLAELAADMRASTPSNAAELLVPELSVVLGELQAMRTHSTAVLSGLVRHETDGLAELRLLVNRYLRAKLEDAMNDLQSMSERAYILSPSAVLKRGYALVRSSRQLVRSAKQLSPGDTVSIELSDGDVLAEVQ
ncbi:exodeoxyribonuclease VII large subunit, partial [Candidatus Saccharibacteria bacterium]|nr:exodeoxyribonuclease VII large subunit [Candidatus Saccharibacteria bacterium]